MNEIFSLISRYCLLIILITTISIQIKAQEFSQTVEVANFDDSATSFKVKGLNGFMINQTLEFGDYTTSSIKRGWNFSSSFQYTKLNINPEEMLLKVFDINNEKSNMKSSSKFQYTLENDDNKTEIYATESFTEKQLVYKSNNPYIGNASQTLMYKYAFTAGIIPVTGKYKQAWLLVLINRYDKAKDTAISIFDKPFVETEGYATDGVKSIAIQPVIADAITNKKGKRIKILEKIFNGYNLYMDNHLVARIDNLNNIISILNSLDTDDKLLFTSIATAILLKNVRDIENDV